MPRIVTVEGKPRVFPDDATDAEISDALNAKPAGDDTKKGWLDVTADWAPTAGGAVGGMAGGIPGAVIGGTLGTAVQQGIRAYQGDPSTADPKTVLARTVGGGAAQGAMQAVGEGIAAAGAKMAPALMQSALKPGLRSTLSAVKGGKVPPVVQTLLDEGVNVSSGGLEKLNQIIGASNDEIQSLITGSGAKVSPYRVASRLTQTARDFAKQVNPNADLEAISKAGQEFLETYGGQNIPANVAQELKTGTYAQLKGKAYGELKGAEIEAQKALARGLKQEIADGIKSASGVDITAPNLREGAAIEARDAVAKRVAMAANRDPSGIAWLAHNPATFLAFIAERNPAVKSMVARGLWKSAGVAAKVDPQLIRFAVGAIASSGSDSSQASAAAPIAPMVSPTGPQR